MVLHAFIDLVEVDLVLMLVEQLLLEIVNPIFIEHNLLASVLFSHAGSK